MKSATPCGKRAFAPPAGFDDLGPHGATLSSRRFDHARRDRKLTVLEVLRTWRSAARKISPRRTCGPSTLLSMCDDTGLFQHAVHCVPDRTHGYCVDDNARALLVAMRSRRSGEEALSDRLTTRFASFIQHAWNTDAKRFQEFLEFR